MRSVANLTERKGPGRLAGLLTDASGIAAIEFGRLAMPFGCERGIIAVEFALILPFMMAALFGGYTASELVRVSMKTWNAAQTISDLVAQQTSVTSAQITDFCKGATLIMAPFTGALTATVASVTDSNSGTRAVDWQDTTCGGGPIATALTLGTSYTPNAGDSVIIVEASFTYMFPVSYVLPSSVTFKRHTFARPRNGTKVAQG